MPHHAVLVLLAVLFLAFGAASKPLENGIVTAPMLAAALGLLASPLAGGPVALSLDGKVLTVIGELALAIVLFNDASGIALGRGRGFWSLPVRLLAIGLPLTMAAGVLAGLLCLPHLPLLALALIACILAPTDAALGVAVVTNPLVPQRIRDAINVESGLNDGLALPPILMLLVLAGAEGGWTPGSGLKEVLLGTVVGVAVAQIGGRLVEAAWRRGWMEHTYARLASSGLALLAFSGANLADGNGFVAAYLGGLVLAVRDEGLRERMRAFAEADGTQFMLLVFLLFGLAIVPAAAPHWTLAHLAYAVLSLTVVRMVPVALSLLGSGLDRTSMAFIGWFGPRGIASVLYLTLVLDRLGAAGQEEMVAVVSLTVLLSILAHGVSATPLATAYGRRQTGSG
jgi:NhaP-type Na+/H+ or K+/H+ antiporter